MAARTRQISAPETAALRISLVGEVSLTASSGRIGEDRLAGRQGRLLFAYLVTEHGRPVARDELADLLWAEAAPVTWEKALTVLVSKVRAALAESGLDGAATLTGARGYYRLDLPEGTWIDIAAAAESVKAAASALVDGRLEDALGAADAARKIVRRPFLPGDDAPWVEAKRRELADMLDEALAYSIDAQLALARPGEAARLAEEAIALQPFRESGYRRLMQAHAAAGNRAEALRVYDRCRRLLSEELGAYPSPETEAIFRELLQEPAPDPARGRAVAQPPAVIAASAAAEPAAAVAEPAAAATDQPRPMRASRRRLAIAGALAAAAFAAVAVVVSLVGGGESTRTIGGNSVASLDAATGTLKKLTSAERAYGSISAGRKDLWATDAGNSAAVRLDRSDGSVRDTIPVGADPSGIVAAYGSVWVANAGDGTLSRISPERGSVVQALRVGSGPVGIAAGAGALWVANRLDSTLVRVDPREGRIVATVPLSAAPAGIAFAAGSVWVTGELTASVSRVDPATNEVAQTMSVTGGADRVAASGRSVWVTNAGDKTVSRIDTRTNAVTGTFEVRGVPVAEVAAPDGVWVARTEPAALVKIDPARGGIVRTIPIAAPPAALTAAGDRVWLTTTSVPHRGGTLRVVAPIYDPRSLDPATSYDSWKWQVAAPVYDGLVALQRVGGPAGDKVVPDLARSLPTVTDGGRTYRFQLRRGIRYSDGQVVRASDFKHSITRLARVHSPGAGFFAGIRSITTDDVRGTVVFRLRRPDPEFATKLALPFAGVVPRSTPMRDIGRPLGTGPYRIASLSKDEAVLVRNRYFRPWSPAAQPSGNPDRIVVNAAADPTKVVSSQSMDAHADVVSGSPDPGMAGNLLARYAARMRSIPLAANLYAYLNTHVAPFDDVRVRRAVNYAVDRRAAARGAGAPLLAKLTCQTLPVGLLGYRPYCPYTRGETDAGVWTGPDLAKARGLIDAAGKRGARVTIWGLPDFAGSAREVARAMRRIGLRARARVPRNEGEVFARAADSRTRTQAIVSAWGADYYTPYGFLHNAFDCKSFLPANPGNANYAEFCDARSQRAMDRALAAEATDLGRAGRLWERADREITDAAPTIPLANIHTVTIVSKRVRDLQFHPLLGPLLSQISLR